MKIWTKIQSLLRTNNKLYLLTVVQSIGSAPGRQGFKMLVTDEGLLFGSIGGGVMEFNMVEMARSLLDKGIVQQHAISQVHKGGTNASSGMICSGSQVIGFNFLCSDDLGFIDSVIQSQRSLEYSADGIKIIKVGKGMPFLQKSLDVWSYCEAIQPKPIAHIFGAGHVSVPTSDLLTKIGFDVFLYDNRSGINTYENNTAVCKKKTIDYEKLLNEVAIDSTDYVLLMTHKFTEDKLLLSQLLTINIKYLGVLGSKNKIKIMFDALIAKGFQKQVLDAIDAPIGVNINSQTIEEIAVSIVAEIIKTKNR